MNENISEQVKKDINSCHAYSICLDESTDVTLSARLAIIARYQKNNEMHEELIKLATLSETTTGADICQSVVTELRNADLDVNKIVFVTTDGAPKHDWKRCRFCYFIYKTCWTPTVSLSLHCSPRSPMCKIRLKGT